MRAVRFWLAIAALPLIALLYLVAELAAIAIAAPLALVIGVTVLLTDLASSLRRQPLQPAPPSPLRGHSVSIVVPSWNGRDHLEGLMPSLRAALDHHGGEHQIIIVDNGSSDDTAAWLHRQYPEVEVVALPENRYFGGGIRAGVARATGDVLVLLNNDMVVDRNFLQPLLDGFTGAEVFAVTSQIYFPPAARRREETGKTRGELAGGVLDLRHIEPNATDLRAGQTPVFWAGGGSSAFDRRKFVELGGYDRIYDPFYLEDTDLCYRAWRRGWTVTFAAASGVVHEHRGTSRRLPAVFVERTIRRNQYLFMWRNVTDARITLRHVIGLPLRVVKASRRRKVPRLRSLLFELTALAHAMTRLLAAMRGRQRAHQFALTDNDVLRRANRVYRPRSLSVESRLRVLVLCARLPRLDTDGSWILFHRLRELARHHDIVLFAFIDHADDASFAEPLREFCSEVVTHVRSETDHVRDLHHRIPFRLARDYSSPPMRTAVMEMVDNTDFDVIQVEYAEMAHLVHRELAGLPSVYTVHESMSVFHYRLFEQARGLHKIPRYFAWCQNREYEVDVVRNFGAVVTLSDADERALHRDSPGLPITTIPSGIDTPAAPPPPQKPESPRVTFVGYFQHPPNVDGAIWLAREVMPLVRREVAGAELYIVGRDPAREVLALASAGGVTVTGGVDDLAPYMAVSAAMAVPIRLGGGLRGKVLEAWAAGKAVVTTSRGAEGFPVVHGNNAMVADDPETFATHLVACLQDAALRRRLGRAGHEIAATQFTHAAAAQRFATLYRGLLRLQADTPAAARPAVTATRKAGSHAR